MKKIPRILRFIAGPLTFTAASALAGGPSSVCSGVPTKYPGAGTITLNYDGGGALGSRSKAQADAIVAAAISLWSNVGTSSVILSRGADLPVDVTIGNYTTYYNNNSDGLNPVIYDTDGSIIDSLLGIGAKNYTLGFAGSTWWIHPTYCEYMEGEAVINGFITSSDIKLTNTIAHEVGHLIGLDHTQLDSGQGLASANYPLMYPINYRSTSSLHADDVAVVSTLYPDTTLTSIYGELTGNFTQVNGTPIRGANLWAQETTTHEVYSIVSDYLMQNNGYFKLLLPTGTYTLHAEAIQTQFTGGSGVGPYSDTPSNISFQPPLYNGGIAMTPVTLGGSVPTQFAIIAACAATATFKLNGTGSIGGNCVTSTPPSTCSYIISSASPSISTNAFASSLSMTSSAGCAWTAISNVGWITITGSSSGSGNGSIAYSVSANTGTSARTGTISIGGQKFSINQSGSGANNYVTQVQTIYIAYFGRPADPGGLAYYSNLMFTQNGSYAAMLDDFWNSPETQGLYNQSTVSAKVNQIYHFLFSHDADAGGLAYWSGLITSGQITLPSAAYVIAYNAESADAAILAGKQSAAAIFTAHVDTATETLAYANCVVAGRTFLLPVVSTATIPSANSMDTTIAGLQSCSGGFNEQFQSGFPATWTANSGTWQAGYNGSVLDNVSTHGVSSLTSIATFNGTFSNLDYSAQVARMGCTTCSNRLVIRASGSIVGGVYANAYHFNYTGDGSYSVFKYVYGNSTALQGWTASSAIAKRNGWNVLRVVANGSNLTFYINGVLVWSGSDSSVSSGRVGFSMYSDGTSTDYFFADYATLTPQ